MKAFQLLEIGPTPSSYCPDTQDVEGCLVEVLGSKDQIFDHQHVFAGSSFIP